MPFSGLVPPKLKKRVGYVCIDELFDISFNMGYGGGGGNRPWPKGLRQEKGVKPSSFCLNKNKKFLLIINLCQFSAQICTETKSVLRTRSVQDRTFPNFSSS